MSEPTTRPSQIELEAGKPNVQEGDDESGEGGNPSLPDAAAPALVDKSATIEATGLPVPRRRRDPALGKLDD